jgi:hypothetical protein
MMHNFSHADTHECVYVEELIEMVFINLSYHDLRRVQTVSHLWKDFVTRSRKLQKQLYKIPTKDLPRNDPHFELASPEHRAITNQDLLLDWVADDQGTVLSQLTVPSNTPHLDAIPMVFVWYFENIASRPSPESGMIIGGWVESWQEAVHLGLAVLADNLTHAHDLGANPGLSELLCDTCSYPHSPFAYSNLHPALLMLDTFPLCCIQGYGSTLFLRVAGDHAKDFATKKSKKEFRLMVGFCKQLKAICDAIECSSLGRDFVTCPVSKRLVGTEVGFYTYSLGSFPVDLCKEDGLVVADIVGPLVLWVRDALRAVLHRAESTFKHRYDKAQARRSRYETRRKLRRSTEKQLDEQLASDAQGIEYLRKEMVHVESLMGALWLD